MSLRISSAGQTKNRHTTPPSWPVSPVTPRSPGDQAREKLLAAGVMHSPAQPVQQRSLLGLRLIVSTARVAPTRWPHSNMKKQGSKYQAVWQQGILTLEECALSAWPPQLDGRPRARSGDDAAGCRGDASAPPVEQRRRVLLVLPES